MEGGGRARRLWVRSCVESGGVASGWDTSLWTQGDREEGLGGRLEGEPGSRRLPLACTKELEQIESSQQEEPLQKALPVGQRQGNCWGRVRGR